MNTSALTSTAHTVDDCQLDGAPVRLDAWPTLSSEELARIVGLQQPSDALEDPSYFSWEACLVPISELMHATQDGDVPDGGWSVTYLRHWESDQQAVANGSPEYAGRDAWIREVWLPDTRIYPLYVVKEWDEGPVKSARMRLLDGHHRLAGAFHYRARKVFVLVGTPLMQAPTA